MARERRKSIANWLFCDSFAFSHSPPPLIVSEMSELFHFHSMNVGNSFECVLWWWQQPKEEKNDAVIKFHCYFSCFTATHSLAAVFNLKLSLGKCLRFFFLLTRLLPSLVEIKKWHWMKSERSIQESSSQKNL